MPFCEEAGTQAWLREMRSCFFFWLVEGYLNGEFYDFSARGLMRGSHP